MVTDAVPLCPAARVMVAVHETDVVPQAALSPIEEFGSSVPFELEALTVNEPVPAREKVTGPALLPCEID